MTAKGLRDIDREINRLRSKRARLQEEATNTTQTLSFTPHGNGTSDKVGSLITQAVDMQQQIENLEKYKQSEINRLSRDIYQENCLFMYYGLHYSWTKIAMIIGGNNTADGVRKACERYEW